MNAQSNKARIARFVEEVKNLQRIDRLGEYFHPLYRENDPVIAGCGPGIEGYGKFLTMANAAIPDNRIAIDLMVAEGDLVVFVGRITGTQKGAFLGVPASGKTATWTEVQAFRFEGEKVAEHWVYADVFAFLQQVGALPPPK
jgi:steroid delta-isomerase-like uncharacterized protein